MGSEYGVNEAPPGGDRNRAANILSVFWIPFPFILLMVAARLYVRRTIRYLGLDDYLMFVAAILLINGNIFITMSVLSGGGRHVFYLSNQGLSNFIKWNYLGAPFAIMGFAFGKSSVGVLLVRLLGPTASVRKKWFLYICLESFFAGSIEAAIVEILNCIPPSTIWEVPQRSDARCLNPSISSKSAYIIGGYGVFIDVLLALYPIYMLWGVKLSTKKKINICILMGFGIFTAVSSALKAQQLYASQGTPDMTWDQYGIILWSALEGYLVVTCGCIPPLKPLYDYLFRGKPLKRRLDSTHQHTNRRSYIRRRNHLIPDNPGTTNKQPDSSTELVDDTISIQSVRGLVSGDIYEMKDLEIGNTIKII